MFLNAKIASAIALAGAALLLPAAAHAEQHSLERDGVSYVYTVKAEKGRTVIAGTADRRTPFRLVVRGEHVTGEYNNRPVSFSVREAKPDAAVVAVR